MKNALSSGLRQAARGTILTALLTCLVLGVTFVDPVYRTWRDGGYFIRGFSTELMTTALQSETLTAFLPILAVLPFGGSFVDDVKSKFARFFLIRSSYGTYAVSRSIVAFFTGGLAVLAGALVTWGAAAVVFWPMERTVEGLPPADTEYLWQILLLLFFNGGLWSLAGLTMSTFMESKYIAYASPFILYYLLVILCERYFPDLFLLYPVNWLEPEIWPFGAGGAVLFLGELAVVLGIVFSFRTVRRLKTL